jgi:hypothetical protein
MKKLLALCIIMVLSYSCTKDNEESLDEKCISHEQAYIISANVPVNGIVNQTIPINISFSVYNGCGSFENFTETNTGNTKTIRVNALYEGCICTQAIETIQTTYNFTPTTTGMHTLNFSQPNGDVLTYTIDIQ